MICLVHVLSLTRPTSGTAVTLKTGRREVPGSNPGRACRPSHSEFSMIFFETSVNTGYDPLERQPGKAIYLQSQVPQWTTGIKYTTNQPLQYFAVFSTGKMFTNLFYFSPHQWRSGTAFRASRREVSSSNLGLACQPSLWEFSWFSPKLSKIRARIP